MTTPADCILDRTGFPYLPLPSTRLAIGLLPVTKAQVEVYLADPAGPGDDWYAELLAVGPRAGWRSPAQAPATEYVLTGVLPPEVEQFCGWLGAGYRLPNVPEWRAGDRTVAALPPDWFRELADTLPARGGHPAATGLLRRFADAGRETAPERTLFRDGVLEWVTKPGGPPGGLGRPPAGKAGKMIIDPQSFDPVVSLRPGRNPLFGVRLVRTVSPGARP